MSSTFILPSIPLWNDTSIKTTTGVPSITPMLLAGDSPRPAVLIIPGGGYGCVCETTEGSPIGKKFNELGYHAFVLDYRTAPDRWPAPQQDAMRAMKIIRANSAKWNIDPSRVYSCGFSAGAHLAGSLGTICGTVDASAGDEYDQYSSMPDGMILCYGVLSFTSYSHHDTIINLLGEVSEAEAMKKSLPEHVSATTPPTFLMHTICDQAVPFRNSMDFAAAMAAVGRPCQLSLFNWGDHGMLLGLDTLDVKHWPEQAAAFLESVKQIEKDPSYRERYTNPYQAQAQRR